MGLIEMNENDYKRAKEYSELIKYDESKANLSGADLFGANLSNVNLIRANLSRSRSWTSRQSDLRGFPLFMVIE